MKTYILSFYNRLEEYPTKFSLSSMRLAASSADLSGLELKILPFELNEPSEHIAQELINRNADIVGFPAYMWTSLKAKEVAEILEERQPSTLKIVGGPETATLDPSSWPKPTLFVLGEGEEPLRWILEKKRDNFNFIRNDSNCLHPAIYTHFKDRKEAIKQISPQLPVGVPIYSDKFMNVFENISDLENKFTWHDTTVGCIYNCGYCGHRTRPGVAFRPDEIIEIEIKKIGEIGFKESFIIDPILGGERGRDKSILQLYKKYAPETAISAYCRPECLDHELIQMLSKSNIKEILIGLQSTNLEVPKWLRSNDLEKVKEYLPELSKRQIPNRIELIVGMPGDSLKGLKESIRFVIEEIKPTSLWAYHLTLIPGTPLHKLLEGDKMGKRIWVHTSPNTSRITETNTYSAQEMDNMLTYAGAITSLYNTLKEREHKTTDEKSINLKLLEKIVERKLLNADPTLVSLFKSSNMLAAKAYWSENI